MLQRRQLKIAGLTIREADVIAVLESTKHLHPWNRRRVLNWAAKLVEADWFGIPIRLSRVRAMGVRALRKRQDRVAQYETNVPLDKSQLR